MAHMRLWGVLLTVTLLWAAEGSGAVATVSFRQDSYEEWENVSDGIAFVTVIIELTESSDQQITVGIEIEDSAGTRNNQVNCIPKGLKIMYG